MNEQISNILFICMGNICRSPFAEKLFKKLVKQKGRKGLFAESAGLYALPGNSATSLAQRVAAEYGVNLAEHKAQPVTTKLVKWSDLILVMEKPHEKTLLITFSEAADKSHLIRRFARFGSKSRGIADPYGLNYDAYRFCYLDIEDAITGLVDYLSNDNSNLG